MAPPNLMSSTADRRIWPGFCFEIVTLDLKSGEISHLEFILSLVIFLDKKIFKKGYSVIFLLICFNI